MSLSSWVITSKILWVSTTGNDSLAVPYNLDRPYATYAAAATDYTVGDTIKYLPGTYNEERDLDLLPNGGTIELSLGTILASWTGTDFTGTIAGQQYNIGGRGQVNGDIYAPELNINIYDIRLNGVLTLGGDGNSLVDCVHINQLVTLPAVWQGNVSINVNTIWAWGVDWNQVQWECKALYCEWPVVWLVTNRLWSFFVDNCFNDITLDGCQWYGGVVLWTATLTSSNMSIWVSVDNIVLNSWSVDFITSLWLFTWTTITINASWDCYLRGVFIWAWIVTINGNGQTQIVRCNFDWSTLSSTWATFKNAKISNLTFGTCVDNKFYDCQFMEVVNNTVQNPIYKDCAFETTGTYCIDSVWAENARIACCISNKPVWPNITQLISNVLVDTNVII